MTIQGSNRNIKETGVLRKPAERTPVAKTLINKFNDLDNQKRTLPFAPNQVLDRVLANYLSENKVEPVLAQELQAFQIHLQQESLGNWFRFTFTCALPPEVHKLISYVAIREEKLVRSASPLVIDCDNIIALNGRSGKAIYEQACRLERALNNQEIADVHVTNAHDRLDTWIDLVYDKFADIVINATSFSDLQSQFTQFKSELCKDLLKMSAVRKDLEDHFYFLEKNDFFSAFYHYRVNSAPQLKPSEDDDNDPLQQETEHYLADQADFVDRFFINMESTDEMTPTLKRVLDAIIVGIPEKAYQPCNAMKHQLIADPDNTVSNVIEELDTFVDENWDPFNGTELLKELNDLLDEDQDELVNWEAVSLQQRRATPIPQPPLPAFQVFSFKYTLQDPCIDPAELLEEAQEQQVEHPITPAPLPICDASADHTEPRPTRSRSRSF